MRSKILEQYLDNLNQIHNLDDFTSTYKNIIIFESEKDIETGLLKYDNIDNNSIFIFTFPDEKNRIFHTVGMKYPIHIFGYNRKKILVDKKMDCQPGIKKIHLEPSKYIVEILA